MNITINGASGRMGRMLVNEIMLDNTLQLVGAVDKNTHAANVNYDIIDSIAPVIHNTQTVIDFTYPGSTLEILSLCVANRVSLVIGTTSFTDTEINSIMRASTHIPIVMASNFSVGVNLVFILLDKIARTLDDEFAVEIFESHHKHKVDAPSGTAISMGDIIAQAKGRSLNDVAVYDRHSRNRVRQNNEIGFAVKRSGSTIGDHVVSFDSDDELIEIRHTAHNRSIFAKGAVLAAKWLKNKPAGFYNMQDVLAVK